MSAALMQNRKQSKRGWKRNHQIVRDTTSVVDRKFKGRILATTWERLAAQFLDVLTLGIFIFMGILAEKHSSSSVYGLSAPNMTVGLLGCFQMLFVTTRGQTLGKMLMGIQIVRNEDDGNPGFVRGYLQRSMIPGLLVLVLPVWGALVWFIDGLFILSPSRRCLHDHLVNTKVVKVAMA